MSFMKLGRSWVSFGHEKNNFQLHPKKSLQRLQIEDLEAEVVTIAKTFNGTENTNSNFVFPSRKISLAQAYEVKNL